ncbi:hydroxylamine reductase [Insolitispirillum peregrinum]|uniref:Hydroxylamine reductase n=1 Tax=Insolitispirillum peregrinum TaxID=80876 RepID=A0A1N7IZI3_9PROT|nr:hydroxylamine reductase [Insolitispirillum peregrinum]SIS42449.1 hydroxylamine reductase precursor [Insolitispirillum peregrinum]
MFCYQCEQTAQTDQGAGCASQRGNCGKDEQTSDLQDLLIHAVKGIAQVATAGRSLGVSDPVADAFILKAMFSTLTNVNFNPARFTRMIADAAVLRENLKAAVVQAASARGVAAPVWAGPAAWVIPEEVGELLAQAECAAIRAGEDQVGADIIGLRALVLYGLKGVCAYAYHALMLGQSSQEVYAGIEQALDFLANEPADVQSLLDMALTVGTINLSVMALLDAGNTGSFGTPEPSQVRISPVAGKAILVSGHDMADLKVLLDQTAGQGINIYTHGEMLPAHSYPALKAYPHLVGNYGGAWQDQQKDFAEFPGAILMTSNCLIEPGPRYRQRIFTTGPVGWPGLRHLEDHAFAPVIQAAKALPGFAADAEEKTITIGFGRDAVLSVADTVIEAVKGGAIRHFFLVGGCDGADSGRNYYTDFVEQTPQDTVVLTLGCNKYRFNTLDLGSIGGIPRLLDMGQCNDSYSAIQVASALAKAFDCGVNDLPLSLVVSWFEQKAAAVLLTLLALGLKGIRLGPTLPAFITPTVLQTLVDAFDIKPIGTPEGDLAAILQTAAE